MIIETDPPIATNQKYLNPGRSRLINMIAVTIVIVKINGMVIIVINYFINKQTKILNTM